MLQQEQQELKRSLLDLSDEAFSAFLVILHGVAKMEKSTNGPFIQDLGLAEVFWATLELVEIQAIQVYWDPNHGLYWVEPLPPDTWMKSDAEQLNLLRIRAKKILAETILGSPETW